MRLSAQDLPYTALTGILHSKVRIPTSNLHSMRQQKQRVASLAMFKSGHTKVLVATDVASRGLDIPEVKLVVNHNILRVSILLIYICYMMSS